MEIARKFSSDAATLPIVDIVVNEKTSKCLFTTRSLKLEGNLFCVNITGFVPRETERVEVFVNAFSQHNFLLQGASLINAEYGQNIPHIPVIGGGMSMEHELIKKVVEYLSKEDVVEAVYSYIEDDIMNFVIMTDVHDPDINLHLSDIYWKIYDEYPRKFEFKPIPKDYFQDFELPEEAIQIIGR